MNASSDQGRGKAPCPVFALLETLAEPLSNMPFDERELAGTPKLTSTFLLRSQADNRQASAAAGASLLGQMHSPEVDLVALAATP